ncbi:MAG: GNAT family N-acetyltransferase [Chloroflexota bacterium]
MTEHVGDMPLSGVSTAVEDPTTPDALELIRLLSSDLAARYDFVADGSGLFAPADVQVPRAAFVVARLDGYAVGCGALRPLDDTGFEDAAEIKRMYVRPEIRGRRVAAAILDRLEQLAREFGYGRAVLETGDRNPEAIRLYERTGYQHIPPYGPYIGSARSVCFAKFF